MHHVCTRLKSGDGEGDLILLIVSRIADETKGNPGLFTFAFKLRVSDSISGTEVFPRIVSRLVLGGYFRSLVPSHETLRFMEARPKASADEQGQAEPMWAGIVPGQEMFFASCQLVLARSSMDVTAARGRRPKGDVTVREKFKRNRHRYGFLCNEHDPKGGCPRRRK